MEQEEQEVKPAEGGGVSYDCKGCGADLQFQPGTNSLVCPFCGALNEIVPVSEELNAIAELDFKEALKTAASSQKHTQIYSVKCKGCGAEITLDENVTSDFCPFCGTSIVASDAIVSDWVVPGSLLPFGFDERQANQHLRRWIGSLWFAPNELKKFVQRPHGLKGMYVPYWTFDASTSSDYHGGRGVYYYVEESHIVTVNGRQERRSNRVRKTRWHSASGRVSVNFDDVLVIGSNSLPHHYADKLEPWDLSALVPYQDKYLAGFRSEKYQVQIEAGFEVARRKMDPVIRSEVHRDIGGDEQRIDSLNTNYSGITFKHILLPLWIGTYRYKEKVHQFVVNARTGEVQGSRPYSAAKIAMLIVTILIVLFFIYLVSR